MGKNHATEKARWGSIRAHRQTGHPVHIDDLWFNGIICNNTTLVFRDFININICDEITNMEFVTIPCRVVNAVIIDHVILAQQRHLVAV